MTGYNAQSDQGQLQRVEMLRPGMFWDVWAEYFPNTDLNRINVSLANSNFKPPLATETIRDNASSIGSH